jgi:hypothetical protein
MGLAPWTFVIFTVSGTDLPEKAFSTQKRDLGHPKDSPEE